MKRFTEEAMVTSRVPERLRALNAKKELGAMSTTTPSLPPAYAEGRSTISEPPPKGRRRHSRRSAVWAPWWFAAPAIAFYAFVVVVPSAQGSAYAFTDWNGLSKSFHFVGFDNFVRVLGDDTAVRAIVNTLVLAAVIMIAQNALGLLLAVALNTAIRTRNTLRLIFFAPVILTPLVSGYIWSYLLAPRGGINSILDAVGLGALRQDWLGDTRFALLSVCAAVIWQFVGYSMVIFLAGLQAIPVEVMEAAAIDGAGPVRRFFSITLPLINGAIVINLVLTLIGALSQFDQVMAMTQGGPLNATETLSTAIYRNGFQLGDYGYATALGVIMTILVAGLAVVQYRLTLRRVDS
jgi:raffinose/stachyose/melibiose transport system permease protein